MRSSAAAHRLARRSATLLAVTAAALIAAPVARAQATAPPLTVERLAALPSLTGTPPSDPAWSPDSRHLAFLWNDAGMPFRDVWVTDAAGAAPRRLTRYGLDRTPPADDPTSLAALSARAAFRAAGGVSALAWAPDGAAVVFSLDGDIHRVPLDGGPPARLTRGGQGASRLAFSPDGRFLSFLRAGDLWLHRMADGALVRATNVGVGPIGHVPGGRFNAPDVSIRSYAWSPDSRRVALAYVDLRNVRKVPFPDYLGEETTVNLARRAYPGDEGEERRVAFYTVADGLTRFVDLPERTARSVIGYAWSPDGTRLLVEQDSDDAETRWLYVVQADGAVRELWRDHRERRLYSFFTSTWRGDGQAVIFVCDQDYYRLCSLPAEGGTPARLTEGAFDVAGARGAATVTVNRPTRQLFFVASRKSPYERQVYRMPDAGGPLVEVTRLEGVHEPLVSPDGTKVALLHSNDLSPIDLYVTDAAGGAAERRVTRSPLAEFSARPWVRPRYVTFKSRRDGFTLHGRLLVPPGLDPTKKYPVALGTVYSNTVRNEWRDLDQTLPQFLTRDREYITLQVDLRGSVGYGVAFREAFQGDWGGGDLEDLHGAVDYLKTLPYVDPDRIGVWGTSYGGMMVLFALFERPGLFRAGVAGAPAIEVARFTRGDMHLSRRPSSHPQIFRASTLLNYGERLRDPLLFIHGLQDDIVPFKSSVAMTEKLMTLGKDFEMAVSPRSGHVWVQREHDAVFMVRKLVEFLDRHLGRGPSPGPVPRSAPATTTTDAGAPGRLALDRLSAAPALSGAAPASPTWSPDSRTLAFLWNERGGATRDLYVVPASGGAPRRLTGGDADAAASGVSGLAWLPDASAVLYLQDGDVHAVAPDGTGRTRLTRTGGAKTSLAASPDGAFVSWLQDGDLWLRHQRTGDVVRATRVGVAGTGTVPLGTYNRPDVEIGPYVWGAGVPAYLWSPDSRHVAVHYVDRRGVRRVPFPYYLGDETTVNVLRRGYPGDTDEIRTIGFYDVANGRLRLVEFPDVGARHINGFTWAGDGRLLIDQVTDTQQERWLYLASPADLRLTQAWYDRRDSRGYTSVEALWDAEAKRILMVGDLDDRYRLYAIAPGATTPVPLTPPDMDVSSVSLVGTGATRAIVFTSNGKSPYERHVVRMGPDGGPLTQVTTLAGTHQPFPSPDGRSTAVLFSDDVTPPDLYLTSGAGTAEARVTSSPPEEFRRYRWTRPRYVTFKSRIDGHTLHARILEPPDLDRSRKHPILFGPVYSNTVRNQWRGPFSLLQQYLAIEKGYIVVQVDVRGSTGYGRAFREAFVTDYGGADLDDLHSAIDYLKTVPWADTDRAGIWGSSYGGLLATYMLMRKPGLFKAGVAGAAAVDPHFFGVDDAAIARTARTHPDAFRRGAAATYASGLADPLLFIHGMQDDVVPFKTIVALAEQLMLLGKDFDLAIAPAATHGWSQRPHYAAYMFRRLVAFFDRHLAAPGAGGRAPAGADGAAGR